MPWCGPPHSQGQEAGGGLYSPSPGSHLLSLWPVVTHCSSLRVVGTGLLAMLGSTLRQYSVSQNSSLMVNSGLFSTTVSCNKRATQAGT